MPRVLALLLFSLSISTAVRGQTVEQRRLAALGEVWGTLKYFHPYLAYREIDWNQALVRAIPKVRAAETRDEFAAAVAAMLEGLGDPVTRVQGSPHSGRSEADGAHPVTRLLPDGVLVITVGNYQDLRGAAQWNRKRLAIEAEIRKSKAVVFDLRSSAGADESDPGMIASRFDGVLLQSRTPLTGPGQRVRQYTGFPNGASSGDYHPGFYVRDGDVSHGRADAVERPLVFVVNEGTKLSGVALAMKNAGKARIVMAGAASDSCGVETRVLEIGEGMSVRFRIGELVWPDGSTGLAPDYAARDGAEALEAALKLARGELSPARPAAAAMLPARTAHPVERPYPADPLPSPEHRLLAAFQIWAAIEYFSPHKHLMTENWSAVLLESIGNMDRASDRDRYEDAVLRMLAPLHDGHANVRGARLGPYWAMAKLRMVEGQPVVVDVFDPKSGLERGDIIESVDGAPVSARIAHIVRRTSASRQHMLVRIAAQLLISSEERPAELTVRGRDGRTRRASVVRQRDGYRQWRTRTNGPAVAVLPGDTGYADLNRVPLDGVDAMFEQLKNTRSIIFDRRAGDNAGPAVFERLLRSETAIGELDRMPVVSLLDADDLRDRAGGFQQVADRFRRSERPGYRGKVVILNDGLAQSRDEHGALGFIAAGATFIGSPTSGALMTIGYFPIPGGLEPRFSVGDARWPDGRPLQGVGVTPHVLVTPTIQGIREGRDEVLERALEFLEAPSRVRGIGEALP